MTLESQLSPGFGISPHGLGRPIVRPCPKESSQMPAY
jgi:hypothetical protein